MTEALAIRSALLHAASINLTHICLRTDSQVLTRAIASRRRPTDLHGILSDIISLISTPTSPFIFASVVFVSIASNGPADSLAKSCLSSNLGPRP
ncbi:unnamed protein product [Brassica rapa]|uniref:RNase H type-1 domain-containing protein n=1 Tax=Brassica campestris TaxID=3711 RepID=A0A8D9HAZ3_BRACM|nr:unnamed protein product [Brassica rapa]